MSKIKKKIKACEERRKLPCVSQILQIEHPAWRGALHLPIQHGDAKILLVSRGAGASAWLLLADLSCPGCAQGPPAPFYPMGASVLVPSAGVWQPRERSALAQQRSSQIPALPKSQLHLRAVSFLPR